MQPGTRLLAPVRLPAVPPSEACAWKRDGSVGFNIDTAANSFRIVVSTDPTCLQAVSSAGGRVKVTADLGQQIYDTMNKTG